MFLVMSIAACREGGVATPQSQPGTSNPVAGSSSVVTIEKAKDGSFSYLVNGTPQVFIGMDYNPIYRYLSDQEREARYERDFRILCNANVNHILGWDEDKGYQQDKFDEITLDAAAKYGIGVVMPFYLPPEGNYRDEAFQQSLLEAAAKKIDQFKAHPALRMWGVGNEVLSDMHSVQMEPAFGRFYFRLADMFHQMDPNHPVIYREAEDTFIPTISRVLRTSRQERPWLQYGMNIYTLELERILDSWPYYGLDRPLLVSEFGAEPNWTGGRELGYIDMWRMIRAHSDYVLGGAPYVWTTAGPEPTDSKWGLMNGQSVPVDGTFEQLASDWRSEAKTPRSCP